MHIQWDSIRANIDTTSICKYRCFYLFYSFIMHSLRDRAETKGYFGWMDRCEWKHRWIFVIEKVWTMVENGTVGGRRKIAVALLMLGKAARGLVRLHKLRPRYKLAGLQCRLFRWHVFRVRNRPRFPIPELKTRTGERWFTPCGRQCVQSHQGRGGSLCLVICFARAFDRRYLDNIIPTASRYPIFKHPPHKTPQ